MPLIRQIINIGALLSLLASLLGIGGAAPASGPGAQVQPAPAANLLAGPANPTDETKVPHYFGPYPNWANSPMTLPDATVTVDPPASGTQAQAAATVGVNGAITGITVTNPGSGYTAAPIVTITGSGTLATATATFNPTGSVTSVTVGNQGGGYTKPQVTINGGATLVATATAYGEVDALVLTNVGSGYHVPTVSFDLPDGPNGTRPTAHVVCVEANCSNPNPDGTPGVVTITGIVLDTPGSGYSSAPGVAILDGTQFDPIRPGGQNATVVATLKVTSVTVDNPGSGYTTASVTFSDAAGTGSGADATATVEVGAITGITVTNPGSGYLTGNGIKKFTDPLPGLCVPPACPATGKYIPLAVPEAKTYNGVTADEYVIGLIQYRTSFSSSLPPTLVRGYVQLETPANAGISQHWPVTNELLNGTKVNVMNGATQWLAVTPPQWLGPTIVSTKDKPVRIVFYNLLPTGSDGDLFLPTDSSLMGSGFGPSGIIDPIDQGSVMDSVRNPACSQYPKPDNCFADNRATLHLHGGTSPWISDGTPHQWITPANETTPWPEGVSVESVPDMNVCKGDRDGCMTFYYTNQQSARLMFYHDHAWGITRLNVYAGEAAGYLITDDTEKKLKAPGGPLYDAAAGAALEEVPLIVQDRTFVPEAAQLAAQDPTWDSARWGGYGNFWYHHVYMPAQNPGDPSGMSAYGRWMYGPWFWPPATPIYAPIANPYYNMDPATGFTTPLAVPCSIDDPATWQYQTDPFCEPPMIPGTPNISTGMEQFNDTPIVNGTAYPTITLQPKTYRFRILNAANDRFFNFQWYMGDPATADPVLGPTEVALKPAEVAAAQLDPVVFPTPVDANNNAAGPDWIVIGSEGGFLPAPVVVDGQQPTTWITDPTRFDVGNVDLHSLLLAPAERADAIVDFSAFAGQTLILYNDAPAAFPARVPSYDYYTGYPDQSPNGPAAILPGYGPNTRTIMQVKIAANPPAAAFNLTALNSAFTHKANGSGVFESGQHPIIVGQAAYNSAYGKSFAAAGDCTSPTSTIKCDGMARINQQGGMPFTFDTLRMNDNGTYPPGFGKVALKLEPKAIHDEMNSAAFDEFGRMTANLGLEAVPATPALQNVILYPYVNPSTELIDATNLPKNIVTYDANGLPAGDVKITPITGADGSQIWKITHNGVDTHPIHFHLYDVQVLNRVTWDNIIIPTDPTELGWKDTIRVSPLEDTIVALRPIIPWTPWELPNAIRNLNPMLPDGSTAAFNNIDAAGNPTAAITNQLVNFGWEYVYHCHILSHEEMDMMRPVSVALPPKKANNVTWSTSGTGPNTRLTVNWTDNSISETAYVLQRTADNGVTWIDVATIASPLNQPNTTGTALSAVDTQWGRHPTNLYRIVAQNTVGYGGAFMSLTVQSIADPVAPAVPSGVTATAGRLPGQPTERIVVRWTDNSTNEVGFRIDRATNSTFTAGLVSTVVPANTTQFQTGNITRTTYWIRVQSFGPLGASGWVTVGPIAPAP